MYILCIISYPSGISSNNKVYEAMINIAVKYNWEMKIEIHGKNQIKNYISESDIKRADGVVIASEMLESNILRFKDLPVLECSISDPVRQPDTIAKILNRLINDDSNYD